MAAFRYYSPHDRATVLTRLRAAGGVVVDAKGERFRMRIALTGRGRDGRGPIADGEVRGDAAGTELGGVIRPSRVDLAVKVVWLGWMFWMGWQSSASWGFLVLALFGAAVSASSLAERRKEERLLEVLAAATRTEIADSQGAVSDGLANPSQVSRSGHVWRRRLYRTHLLCLVIAAIGFVALYNVDEPEPESAVLMSVYLVVFFAVLGGIGCLGAGLALEISDTRFAFRRRIGGEPVRPAERGEAR